MEKTKVDAIEIFTKVAHRYELLNTLMTAGWDQRWRKALLRAAEKMLGRKPEIVQDLATGTGDLPRLMAKTWPQAKVYGTDPNKAMLDVARTSIEKSEQKNPYLKNIVLQEGRAEEIQAEEGSFDVISIAFGFRNVPEENRSLALKESFRVLRKGGVLLILELGMPEKLFLRNSYQFLLSGVMPPFASLFSNRSSYDYLANSIIEFPKPKAVKTMMEETGFSSCNYTALSAGMCWLFCGKK